MRAVVTNPTRIVSGDSNQRSVFPGDVLEGSEAAEAVASGNAELLEEPAVSPAAPADAPMEPSEPSDPTRLAPGEAWDATEAATAHAKALGVDMGQVEGTGAGGTVTKADVAAHAAQDDGA